MSTQDTLPVEQERERFEAWCVATLNYGYDFSKDAEGDYSHDATETAWFAWEGRAAIAAQAPSFQPAFANGKLTSIQQHELWEASAADQADKPWQSNLSWQLGSFASKLMEAIAAQAQQAQGVPAGWNFNVSHSDGRAWLNITTPAGTKASISCTHKTGNGDETVAAQVLAYLRDDLLAAAPQAEHGVYVGLAQRLMTLSTRLGISCGDSVEHFNAALENNLYAICRGVERLLAAPQAEPQPEPLSDEQIDKLIGSPWLSHSARSIYREFARDVEKAHGIGTKGGE